MFYSKFYIKWEENKIKITVKDANKQTYRFDDLRVDAVFIYEDKADKYIEKQIDPGTKTDYNENVCIKWDNKKAVFCE